MPAREKNEVRVFSDISIGVKAIGVGIHAEGPFGRPLRTCFCIGAGFSPVEAELIAVHMGISLVDSLLDSVVLSPTNVTVYTDCEAAIRAIFDMGKFRSRITKGIVKGIVGKMDRFKEKHKAPCLVQPVGSRENPAHHLAREARKTWTDLLSYRAGSS